MFPALDVLPGRPCPIASSLEVVGERWALLVVREIWFGSRSFKDIVAGTGAPRDRVAARLKALEQAGVVDRTHRPGAPARHFDYTLTDSGRALVPVLQALLDWGRTWAVPGDPLLPRSARPLAEREG